jgi:outer membrane protein assembly factor BamB
MRYDGSGHTLDNAHAIAVDAQGNAYVTGEARKEHAAASGDAVTVKYGTDGTEEWVAAYDGPSGQRDIGLAVAAYTDGNVFVAGSSVGQYGWEDAVLVKYGSTGGQLWAERYGNTVGRAFWLALVMDGSGNAYVTGFCHHLVYCL